MKEEIRTIQSVQRAIDIMNYIADAGRKATLTEISTDLNINVNTVRGLVQTLLVNGYLSKNPERGTYGLGYELFSKGRTLYEEQIQFIMDTAYPEMKSISGHLNITTCLQLSFHSDIYTAETVKAPSNHYIYVPQLDVNLPLYASASGKLLIAYSSENERKKIMSHLNFKPLTDYTITDKETLEKDISNICTNGYATEIDELSMGISSIAAPIFDSYGTMCGALSVVSLSATLKPIFNKAVIEIKQASNRITDKILLQRKSWK